MLRKRKRQQNSIILKSPSEITKMRNAGRLVAETFVLLGEHIRPGVRLDELDRLAEEFIASHDAAPLYKGYRGSQGGYPPFPGVICASVNQEICHGLPDGRVLQDGDIIGIDIGLRLKGYCGDACVTYAVGAIAPKAQRLLDVTQEALRRGIAASQPQHFLHDIGTAIHDYVDSQGMTVVREWGGHGIGRSLHEAPSVSHIRMHDPGPRLRPGMVFTIEPMVNLGKHNWQVLEDGWTVVTKDGSLSAQFEHTLAITADGPEILTLA